LLTVSELNVTIPSRLAKRTICSAAQFKKLIQPLTTVNKYSGYKYNTQSE